MLLAIPYFAWMRTGAFLKFEKFYESELPDKKRARSIIFWMWLAFGAAIALGAIVHGAMLH